MYKRATQTVFGEGPARARIVLVGEQPGDSEDRSGHPFVGPAGTLLRNALASAGIDPADAYITNTVKHFKFVERGKRRIHQKPKVIEVQACMAWLESEIAQVKPAIVVALGATAAHALLGTKFRLTDQRGRVFADADGRRILATVHPSSILRAPDAEARRAELLRFIADLKTAAGEA